LIDRVFGLAALVVMLVLTFPFLAARLPANLRTPLVLVVLAGVVGTALFGAFDLLPRRLRSAWPLRQFATVSVSARAILLHDSGRLAIAALSFAVHGISSVVLFFLVRGMGVGLTFTDCLLVVPPVTLLATLPISLGGWGVREGLLVVALSAFGVAPAHGLAVSIAVGAVLLLNGVLGALPLLFARERFRGVGVPAAVLDDEAAA
jgi:uncharacterized membrane protein YbhN (UPF0104 family)